MCATTIRSKIFSARTRFARFRGVFAVRIALQKKRTGRARFRIGEKVSKWQNVC